MSETRNNRRNRRNKKNKKSINDWKNFGLYILKYIVYIFFFILISCNFIWFTSTDLKDSVNNPLSDFTLYDLLPSDVDDEENQFYQNPPKSSKQQKKYQSVGKYECKNPKIMSNNSDPTENTNIIKVKLDNIFLNEHGFPYSLTTEGSTRGDRNTNPLTGYIKESFKNWIGESVGYSYAKQRGWLKGFLNFFAPTPSVKNNTNIFSHQSFQMLIGAPILMFTWPIVAIVCSIVTFVYTIISGWIWALAGCNPLLPWTFILTAIITFIQMTQYTLSFLVIPLYLNLKKLLDIVVCNKEIIIFLIMCFIIKAAILHLNTETYSAMIIGFCIITIIRFILKKNKKS